MSMRETFQRMYGRDAVKDAADKADAMDVTNPDGRCGYCRMPLSGGASSQMDHKDGDGAEWRKKLGKDAGRIEIRWLKNGTHPAADRRTFICACCNQEKSNAMNADDFVKTPFCIERRRIVEAAGL